MKQLLPLMAVLVLANAANAEGNWWENAVWINAVAIQDIRYRVDELEIRVLSEGVGVSGLHDTHNDNNPQQVLGDEPNRWGPNIATNTDINSIDPLVHTSTISGGGYYGMEQIIGSSVADSSYIPGSALMATISGGYDNLNNQLAGTISGGAHHVLYGAGDHGTIGGGSYNVIRDGSYSVIAGGGGGSDPQSIDGTRSTIGGGGGNHIIGEFNTVAGGYRNTIDAAGSGIGAGRNNSVDARYSYAVGEANYVSPQAEGSFTAGRNVTTAVPGSINVSARGSAGQTIVFNLSNTTESASQIVLLSAGVWTTPIIGSNQVWTGEAHIIGVDENTGAVASYKVSFTANSTSVLHTAITPMFDQLGLSTSPLNLRIGSLSRLEFAVNGVAGRNIKWNSAVVVSQVNM